MSESYRQSDFFASNPPGVTSVLTRARVFVAGAGGLGSNLAMLLARAGVGVLWLADFDRVTPANLNRQMFFRRQVGQLKIEALRDLLLEINPELNLTLLNQKLAADNFSAAIPADIDLVCECFDRAEAKAALTRYMLGQRPDVAYVAVSGLAGCGPVEELKVLRPNPRFCVIGDQHSAVTPEQGTLSSRVAAAAAMEAHCGIRMLLERAGNVIR